MDIIVFESNNDDNAIIPNEEYFALLRVVRAAERLLEQGNQWYGFNGMPGIDKEYKAIVEVLEALPEHLR